MTSTTAFDTESAIEIAKSKVLTLGARLRLIASIIKVLSILSFVMFVGLIAFNVSHSVQIFVMAWVSLVALPISQYIGSFAKPTLYCIEAKPEGVHVVAHSCPTLTSEKQLFTKLFSWEGVKIAAVEFDMGEGAVSILAAIEFTAQNGWADVGGAKLLRIKTFDTLREAQVFAAKFNECRTAGRYFCKAA